VSPARRLLRIFGLADPSSSRDPLARIHSLHQQFAAQDEAALQNHAKTTKDMHETFAITALVAERVLKLKMFDVQLRGALALAAGHIAEMQTGEGKTLAAVPAIVWYAKQGRGMHVLTANDYLARRDAAWMRPVYEFFGLRVAYLSQSMRADERREAYGADVTYATANEVGFDFLRDGLAQHPDEIVQRRGLHRALFDEADSILLDEARIPLVIAGESRTMPSAALIQQADAVAVMLQRHIHYRFDEHGRNVQLTDAGIAIVEAELRCGSLFDADNLTTLTAIQDALHAHTLLRKDVDYVVKNGSVELVDEFKGRIAENRRMPAGLHSAIEAKERLALKTQGRILGSITLQALASLYERVCGMTGTAATQAQDFWKEYKLPVTVVPPNKPVIRKDLPDLLFRTSLERDQAVAEEIHKAHATQRPVLVGTSSVEESERLSRSLRVPHNVLNARNDETADIPLQPGVAELGGLYVIGTSKHDARRIDFQLRGRAGRQGDPGSTRFFVSLEDGLFTRYKPEEGWREPIDIDHVQRMAEGQNFELRTLLWKYESVLEHQRREVWKLRRDVLLAPEWSVASLLPEELYERCLLEATPEEMTRAGRKLTLALIDDLWSDYLANIAELRGGVHWVSFAGKDPLHEFLTKARESYDMFLSSLEGEIEDAFEQAEVSPQGEILFQGAVCEAFERGATWTYLTTDQPFGTLAERIAKGLRRKLAGR
jgi:preprotein translocase subunit SecA